MYNHNPTICAIDENCTVLDVKCHEEYDRLSFVENYCFMLMEKDKKRQILADFWQSGVFLLGFFDFEAIWPSQSVFKK